MADDKIFRKCIACNQLKPRNELIKITFNKSLDEVKVNPDSKFFGRSVYICRSFDCFNNAFKKGKLYKILRVKESDILKEKIRAVLAD